MPAATITINREQRDGFYELIRNHLGSLGELFDALERDKDFAKVAQLGLEFSEDFELLEDIGWSDDEGRESFELTMPAHDLMEVLQRLHGEAGIVLGDSEESREDAETKRRDHLLIRLWREGCPEQEIAEALDLNRSSVGPYVRDLRDAGEDLPYRRARSAVELTARRRRGHSQAASGVLAYDGVSAG